MGIGAGVGVGVAHEMVINCSLSSRPLKLESSPPGATMLLSANTVPYKKPPLTFMFGPLLQVLPSGS